jgi:DNA polymerase
MLIKPKIIVCLGRIAAQKIIHPRYSITREHGRWIYRDGIWYTAWYHPSALLRDLSKRPETFDDLLSLRAKAKEVSADI